MSGEKPPAVEGLVTSDAVRAGAKLRKRLMLGAVCLVVLLALGAGGWYAWTQTSLFHKPAPSKAAPDYSNLPPEEAIKAAQSDLKQATTSQEKAVAYSNLGQAYMRNNQPKQAVSAYQQAVEQSGAGTGSGTSGGGSSGDTISDIATLSQLAYAYAAAGDKADAIKTFDQVITIVKASSDPQKDKTVSRYEAEISYLQGPPK